MIELDEFLYNALMEDETLVAAVGGRIASTCFEVSPDELDNTPLPCIIVTDDGLQNDQSNKDDVWESDEDRVQASVEVGAESPKVVKRLIRMVRKAISNYAASLSAQNAEVPYLLNVQTNGVAWDWMKPCYHSAVSYQCSINNYLRDDEQEQTSSSAII